MGNSASCFDPVREHPPYSWPKDHPGRDAAIAERKRARKNRRRNASDAQPVEKETAKDVVTSADTSQPTQPTLPIPEKKSQPTPIPVDTDTKELPVETSPTEDIKPKQTETDVSKDVETEEKEEKDLPATPVETEKIEPIEDSEDKPQIESEDVKDTTLDEINEEQVNEIPIETEPMVVLDDMEEKEEQEEDVVEKLDVTPVEQPQVNKTEEADEFTDAATTEAITSIKEDDEIEIVKPVEELEAIEPNDTIQETKLQEDTPVVASEVFAEGKEDDDVKASKVSSFDTTRAMFNKTQDNLPEAGDLKRDVLDPVTSEYITLPEYRKRQAERAQGMVKERVVKYEEIDDEMNKRKAEMEAIDAARAKVAGKAEWTFKSLPSRKGLQSPNKTSPGIIDQDKDDEVVEAIPIEDIPNMKNLMEPAGTDSTTTKEANKTTIVEPAILPTS